VHVAVDIFSTKSLVEGLGLAGVPAPIFIAAGLLFGFLAARLASCSPPACLL